MRSIGKTLAGLVAAAAIGGVVTPALATTVTPIERDAATRHEAISYRDLNIATDAGAAALYARLSRAARFVCGYDDDPLAAGTSRVYIECKDNALAQAVARVDQPKLSALYERHFPNQRLVNVEARAAAHAKS